MKNQKTLLAALILVLTISVLSSCQGKSLTSSSHYTKCTKNGLDGCGWHN
jgi:hypothetical protein